MIFILLAGFTIAFLIPLLSRFTGKYTGRLLSILPAAYFAYFCSCLPEVMQGEYLTFRYSWVPELSVSLTFYIDGLSLFFSLLISGFGSLVILYASSYMKGHPQLDRFYMYLFFFMMSMIGLVLSENLMVLYLFWELTTLSSYLLISFKHESSSTRSSALQALLITVAGGLAMLAGFILLGVTAGTYSIPELLDQQDLIKHSSYYPIITILILIGTFTKSAQFPFHFWLPNAMAAPTPVSAYLHSATMVKAGIFLAARLYPALGGTSVWETLLISIGCITMLMGAFMALKPTDLKKILAYTTVSALGLIFLMLGIGTVGAIQAALVYILVHALYKGTLFLVAGNLDSSNGSRDIKELSGLRKKMPYTGTAAILACLSMVGIVPFLGFVGKEMVYEAALHSPIFGTVLLPVILFSNAIYVVIAIVIGYDLFFGPVKSLKENTKEVPIPMLLGPLMISSLGLLTGLFLPFLTQPLLNIATENVLAKNEVIPLSLWHGFNLSFFLSLGTLALGTFIYIFSNAVRLQTIKIAVLEKLGPEKIYQLVFKGTLKTAYTITRYFQNGYLRYYIGTVLLTFVGIILYVLISSKLTLDQSYLLQTLSDFRIYELAICIFITTAILTILYTQSRLSAVVSMGAAGYGLALVFIFFSAPDLAMTQVLIETMTLVLFVLVLHKLPRFESFLKRTSRFIYLFLSLLFGSIMAYVLLLVTNYPVTSELKDFFGENSLAEGRGRNIVNVILVDFRALDTLGESTVIAIAAIGVYTLLKFKQEEENKI